MLSTLGLVHLVFSAAFGELGPASVLVDPSHPGARVDPLLLGHDLEFTRHDLFEGLSAEMVANHKFALTPPCSQGSHDYSCWPGQVQQLVARGIVPRWARIGEAVLDEPMWDRNASLLVAGDRGHSIRCPPSFSTCGVRQTGAYDGFNSGISFGSALVLSAGTDYTLRLALRANASDGLPVNVSLSDGPSSKSVWAGSVLLRADGAWHMHELRLTAQSASTNATLAITAEGSAGWWLGPVSLTPTANAWRGMRLDVIARLRELGAHGLLRYPGGCFAPFYRWKVGLLPPEQRPPIATPPGYCVAVAGGVNAYTDGLMENGVGIDDYIALCHEIGAVPAITVRLQTGSADEIQEARDWVEYCNGDAVTTRWGAVRAARGHPAPFNVEHWYLGNEINMQARFPQYPADLSMLSPPSGQEYAVMLSRLVPQMLQASPATRLRLFAVAANDGWNAQWLRAVGPHIFAASFHEGYMNQPAVPFSAQGVANCGKWPGAQLAPKLQQLRGALDATGVGKNVSISVDEWGLGPPWRVQRFAVAHAVFGAGMLGMALRQPKSLQLAFTNYFEAINEGAIAVGPSFSVLTPVGLVMRAYATHSDQLRLDVDQPAGLDVVATLSVLTGDVTVTLAALNADGRTAKVALANRTLGLQATVTTLAATGFDAQATLNVSRTTRIGTEGMLELAVPPFSVVQAKISAPLVVVV